ncbi:MAG: hypothetical protein QXV27_07605 [Candidatus Caldarchaeum sp.]
MKAVSKLDSHEFELVFEVEVRDVTERDVYGAVYSMTDVVEPCSLSTLQKQGKAGKCILESNGGRHVLTIPMSASLAEAALLAAAIESIDCVAGRPACFKLVKLRDKISKKIELARRAKELMQTF